MFLFFSSALAIAVASILQLSNIFIFGVKPNLPLAFLLVLSLINKSWLKRIALIATSVLILNFYPDPVWLFDPRLWMFIIIMLFSVLAMDLLPWAHLINLIVIIILATFSLNLYHFSFSAVFLEIFYNLLLGVTVFMMLKTKTYGFSEEKNGFKF